MKKSHHKLQNYQHNYGLVLMTGLLGCRWHRYQQSKKASTKIDLACFVLVVLAFLYSLHFFYFWLIADTDHYHIIVHLLLMYNTKIPLLKLGIIFSTINVVYLTLIVVLCLLHIHFGHQLFIHLSHRILCSLILIGCMITSGLSSEPLSIAYKQLSLSLEVYGPILQVTSTVVLTFLFWLICTQMFKLTNPVHRLVVMTIYMMFMMFLYLSPLAIHNPLVFSGKRPKPRLIAIGGGSDIAPEYTELAFRSALSLKVDGIYVTVQMSSDGKPFVHSDLNMKRIWGFSHLKAREPSELTADELRSADIGSWFLEVPDLALIELTEENKRSIREQKIVFLLDLIQQVKAYKDGTLLFLDIAPLPPSNNYSDHVVQQILLEMDFHNISYNYLVWPSDHATQKESLRSIRGYTKDKKKDDLLDFAFLSNEQASFHEVRLYRNRNISVIVGEADSHWLASYYWSWGVDYITTNYISHLQQLKSPVLNMNRSEYKAMWFTSVCLSVLAITIVFSGQRMCLHGSRFSPESISLNTGRSKTSSRCRTMKEKLLRDGAVLDTIDDLDTVQVPGEEEELAGGVVNQQPAYSLTSGQQAYSLSSFPLRDGVGSSSPAPQVMLVSISSFMSDTATASPSLTVETSAVASPSASFTVTSPVSSLSTSPQARATVGEKGEMDLARNSGEG